MRSELDLRALSPGEARRLTDEVKADAAALWAKLLRLYEGGAHSALGYASWGAYFETEFGQSARTGKRLLEAARNVEALGDTHVPPSQNAARELTPLRATPAQLREAWAEAVRRHGAEPTKMQVRAIVLEFRGVRARLRRDRTAERIGRLRDLAREAAAISANDLGGAADHAGDATAARVFLDEVERDALGLSAALVELARLARAVRDEPIVFHVGHGINWRRDGVAPTLLASEVPIVFIPAAREAA